MGQARKKEEFDPLAKYDGMFRPAVRENVGLFIGLAGGTRSGKTKSAIRIAQGIVGRDNKFALIDTENRRGLHYAPPPGKEPDFVKTFNFAHFDFGPPYSSERYQEIVTYAVQRGGYKAVVLDSATHEHEGEGGYLDRQQEELAALVERQMKKYPDSNEWSVIEKMTPTSWQKPKRARARMMQSLLAASVSIPIIFCFRAQEKVFMSEMKGGKPTLVAQNPPIWVPVCGARMPFEMTTFLMLHAERPGVPVPLTLEGQHAHLFPKDRQLDEECGRKIAEWAAGREPGAPTRNGQPAAGVESAPPDGPIEGVEYINADEVIVLSDTCKQWNINIESLKKAANVSALALIRRADYAEVQKKLDAVVEKKRKAAAVPI